ncbi:CARD- and ANK-domain containing inflammasome adapter protein-like, partial [Sitodiplosis mosellana]|uniref:CARD- and ANK-domain containing inflammasome adapter protein-like n=1 Tax=Sitodiplosis mosellana TaxID=263140 RepID=UPI0024444C71
MLSRSSFTLLLIGLMVSEFLIGDVSGAPTRNVNEKDKKGETALHRAAFAGKVKEAQNLIAEGADPNIKNKFNETPLHLAAENGHKSVTEVLSRKAKEFNIKNNLHYTPLHLASMN